MAIKLIFIGVIIIALLAAAAFGWWQGWFTPSSQTPQRSAPTRRAPSR
jgi:DNA-binding transcriptional regulator of glucitol operon